MRRFVPPAAFVLAHLPAVALAGEPKAWEIGFQTPASPTMAGIASLANTVNIVIVGIVVLVSGLLAFCLWRFRASRHPTPATWSHNTKLEIAWTVIPTIILLLIAFPSFRLLYFMDRVEQADLTLKVTGHQWYWSYQYPDHGVGFDAMMVQQEDLQPEQRRLLATDHPVVLPVGVSVRIQLTADDVIHSWAVPALGIKTDSVPGRLNETWVRIDQPGVYLGQCSELCGLNHGFMPIEIKAVPLDEFRQWAEEARSRFPLTNG